jgi:hypothetical protein
VPAFTKGGSNTTPFGRNEILRSVQDVKTDPYMFAKSSLPSRTIDGVAGQKILQPGIVLAKITAAAGTSTAADVGLVGPFQAGVTDGRQTLANIVGINFTFLPWQLVERDCEVAAIYEATLVQAWCKELDAAGLEIVLTNTTRDAMVAKASLSLLFR